MGCSTAMPTAAEVVPAPTMTVAGPAAVSSPVGTADAIQLVAASDAAGTSSAACRPAAVGSSSGLSNTGLGLRPGVYDDVFRATAGPVHGADCGAVHRGELAGGAGACCAAAGVSIVAPGVVAGVSIVVGVAQEAHTHQEQWQPRDELSGSRSSLSRCDE